MWSLKEKCNYYRIRILNQIYCHIQFSICIYVQFKSFSPTYNFMLKLIVVLLSPILYLEIWTMKLVKGVVHLWLACKEGDDFVKMLSTLDSYFMLSEKSVLHTLLLLLEFDGDGEAFRQKLQDKILTVFCGKRFLKLRCSIVPAFGFYYYKRAHWPMDNHFKPLSDDSNNGTMSMESLRKVVSELLNIPVPCNGTALWEVRIGERQLEESRKWVYPIVLRIHHAVCDAAAMFHMFSGKFQNRVPPTSVKVQTKKALMSLKCGFVNEKIDPTLNNTNVLCQTNGNKHVVWYTEEKAQILNAIKKMKAQLKNDVTFIDIILTCFLETLDNYFSKTCSGTEHDKSYPKNILTVVPIMPPNYNFNGYGAGNYKLNNKKSAAHLQFPLKLDTDQDRLLNRLELIHKKYGLFKNTLLNFTFWNWSSKLPLPHFVLKFISENLGISLVASNLPGCNSLNWFGGMRVRDIVAIGPNSQTSGVTFAICSYEKRLCFSYTIDKAVIANVDDVKRISADFIHNLNNLREIINVNTNVKNC